MAGFNGSLMYLEPWGKEPVQSDRILEIKELVTQKH